MIQKYLKSIRPIQVLPLGFFCIILIGTFLLMLPAASANHMPLNFHDAFFTATSATCVTGLVVVDTGTYFSTFGQVVILMMIQIGGLGFMSITTLLFMALRKKISLRERITIAESFNHDRIQGVVKLGINAMKVTFTIELIGAILLSFRFVPLFGAGKGIWYSLFHSISAFCNAGFDLMGDFASLTAFTGDYLVNIVIMLLIVFGGLGFAVITDILYYRSFSRFRLHTKLVLTTTAALIVLGTIFFLATEYNNPKTLGPLPADQKVLASVFQSITTRTAGFNTIDQFAMRDTSKLMSILLMTIGAAPAGTGGGIKVTTFALVLLGVWSVIRGKNYVNFFGRRASWLQVRRALAVAVLFIGALLITVILISYIETDNVAGTLGLENQFFEAASAFGTVGLSTGVSTQLTTVSRYLLSIAMFMGRVGPLTMMLAFAGKKNSNNHIQYPEEYIMVG